MSVAQIGHPRVCPRGIDRAFARVTVGITSGFTGHEQTSNHFTLARMSAPRATLCYPATFEAPAANICFASRNVTKTKGVTHTVRQILFRWR